MRIFDRKLWAHKTKYVLQSGLAAGAVFVVLLILDVVSDTVIIAALGASAFVAFTMPESRVSRPRFLIGGYVIGTLVGCLCHYLSVLPALASLHLTREFSDVAFGALAVGLAIFLMVITNTEHPPAAGLALGFVLSGWDHFTVAVVMVGIVGLSVIKRLLRPVLIDLL